MRAPRIVGLVLASGTSVRFGGNKLTVDFAGESVIARTVRAYREALGQCWVVLGHDMTNVRGALEGLDVHLVTNPDYSSGQSSSLKAAIGVVPEDTEAAVIGVGDQPLLRPETITRVVEAWRMNSAPAVVPLYRGDRGNPALFSRELFPELLSVSGDIGGRDVLRRHPSFEVDIPEWWTGIDIDTPEDLALAEQYLRHPPWDRGGNEQAKC